MRIWPNKCVTNCPQSWRKERDNMRNLLVALVLLVSTTCSVSANSIFITGGVPFGTATPFFETNNGITASFSSPADPGGFQTLATFFSFGPEVVIDPGPAGASFISLDIL